MNDYSNMLVMLRPVVAAMIIVLLAMIIDLISGINKAKQRGDLRTSAGLRRTLSKFIMYEGGMLIASGVDVLIYMSNLLVFLNFNSLQGIPVITCLVGVFLCVVEFISLREKADVKTQKGFTTAEQLLIKALSNDQLVDILASAISKSRGYENQGRSEISEE